MRIREGPFVSRIRDRGGTATAHEYDSDSGSTGIREYPTQIRGCKDTGMEESRRRQLAVQAWRRSAATIPARA